jgi:hypothetical protein
MSYLNLFCLEDRQLKGQVDLRLAEVQQISDSFSGETVLKIHGPDKFEVYLAFHSNQELDKWSQILLENAKKSGS